MSINHLSILHSLAALAMLQFGYANIALAQLPPPGLNTSGTQPQVAQEYSLEDLTPEVLDRIFPVDRGYRVRATHTVDIQDLNACPEAGGSPIHDLIAMGGAQSVYRGAEARVNIQADLDFFTIPVVFGNNSIALSPAAEAGLTTLVAYLSNPRLVSRRILIQGHANATGSKAINYRLTCERAANMRGLFRKKGLAAERLLVMGSGFDAPDPKIPDVRDGRHRRITLRFLPL